MLIISNSNIEIGIMRLQSLAGKFDRKNGGMFYTNSSSLISFFIVVLRHFKKSLKYIKYIILEFTTLIILLYPPPPPFLEVSMGFIFLFTHVYTVFVPYLPSLEIWSSGPNPPYQHFLYWKLWNYEPK
jgi:hypothetical protein